MATTVSGVKTLVDKVKGDLEGGRQRQKTGGLVFDNKMSGVLAKDQTASGKSKIGVNPFGVGSKKKVFGKKGKK